MASDRQSTAGNIVMNKDSEKIVYINDYALFAGTGMVADIQKAIKLTAAELKIKRTSFKNTPFCKTGSKFNSQHNLSINKTAVNDCSSWLGV